MSSPSLQAPYRYSSVPNRLASFSASIRIEIWTGKDSGCLFQNMSMTLMTSKGKSIVKRLRCKSCRKPRLDLDRSAHFIQGCLERKHCKQIGYGRPYGSVCKGLPNAFRGGSAQKGFVEIYRSRRTDSSSKTIDIRYRIIVQVPFVVKEPAGIEGVRIRISGFVVRDRPVLRQVGREDPVCILARGWELS